MSGISKSAGKNMPKTASKEVSVGKERVNKGEFTPRRTMLSQKKFQKRDLKEKKLLPKLQMRQIENDSSSEESEALDESMENQIEESGQRDMIAKDTSARRGISEEKLKEAMREAKERLEIAMEN